MKYLKKFNKLTDYETFKESDKLITPNVSLITENGKQIKYTKRVKQQTDYSKEYFTIEALEDGLTASLSVNTCEYSLDGKSWNSLPTDTNTVEINKGQTLSFRGNLTPTSSNGIGAFTISKKCNVKGNVMSLLYGDDFIEQNDLTGKNYAFYKLFYKCTNIVDASELILPATTLASDCYYCMFQGCTSLVTAPALPATTLAENCYRGMFYDCTSLTTAPELPATTLESSCYRYMFYGCTSLTTAPSILSATTLAVYCYSSMFQGCTSLSTAPELPATTLASYCYESMFSNCTSLNTAPELPATTLASYCYHYMFSSCTSLTTAPELPATTLASYCYYYMFKGCTSLTTAPELPATTLAENCYRYMFGECTSLTTAPELPATTLSKYCYYNMFQGCSSLKHAPELPATTLASYCYHYMFSSCTSLTTAPELPATTLTTWCYESMFHGCTSLTTAPELPATTLASNCYQNMFCNCTRLTTTPELPATTLASSCYVYMFAGCTSLTTATELPATTLASECYSHMFNSCTSLTTAPELTATILASYCYSGMFRGCTSLVTAPALPATTLNDGCYDSMFRGCTSLVTAPALPATTLYEYCYYNMFQGCTSLVTAPELLATELAEDCYSYMFSDCSKLNHITMLANKNVKSSYLYEWVKGVSNTGTFVRYSPAVLLTSGISGIPNGWTVEDYYTITSYKDLSITAKDVAWNSTKTTINWSVTCEAISDDNQTIEFVLTGKTESDSFEQNTSDTDIIREISFTYMGITATTTIVQYAYKEVTDGSDGSDEYLTFTNTGEDALLISILDLNSGDVYAHSFSIDNGEWIEGNKEEEVYAIITPNQSVRFKSNFEPFSFESGEEPHLKAFVILSLEENNPSCSVSGNIMSLLYGDDFIGKTDLTGYDGVFYFLFAGNALIGVDSPITDASNLVLPATTLSYACYYLMFAGCTGLTVAPSILPATTLADGCYQSMFDGCTSLVNAPELPATTLADGCYYYMFSNCNSLNYIKMLATDISANNCLNNWVSGVSSTGTFVKHPDMNYLPIGSDGIPEGWTVVDNV